jgi:hypothetical protein
VVANDVVFQVFYALFQVYHLDVVKLDLKCRICCSDNISMLQTYVSSVSNVSDVCFKCVHLDVAYVAMTLTPMFIRLFQVVHMFHTYVANVSSFAKVDLDFAYATMPIHACFNRTFKYFICFRRILQMFI